MTTLYLDLCNLNGTWQQITVDMPGFPPNIHQTVIRSVWFKGTTEPVPEIVTYSFVKQLEPDRAQYVQGYN